MLFTLKHVQKDEHFVECVKYLGIFMDFKLSWNNHGDQVAKKVSRNIFLLRNLSLSLSMQVLRVAYFAWCIVIWNMPYYHGVIRQCVTDYLSCKDVPLE